MVILSSLKSFFFYEYYFKDFFGNLYYFKNRALFTPILEIVSFNDEYVMPCHYR